MKYSVIKNIGISIAEYLFQSKTYHAHVLDTDIDLRIGDLFLYEKGYVRVVDRQVLFSDTIHHIALLVEDVEKPTPAPKPKKYSLIGLDAFSGEEYMLKDDYPTEADAIAGGKLRLQHNERTQPSSSSGGQAGIQDRVFVERPDGSRFRVM